MMPTTAPAHHTLDRPGCTIHYWLSGPAERPLVVFTHGATIDHEEFDQQVRAIADSYRVLTWDIRGHGLSRPAAEGFSVQRAVDDLLALLAELGASKPIFVGHSLGGNITQELVFYHPDRVKALVMLGCTCNTLKLSAAESFILKIAGPMFALYPEDMLWRQSANGSSIKPDVREYLYQKFSQVPKQDFVAILMETLKCLHDEPGYSIKHPLLLTHGDQDNTGNIRKIAPVWAAREPNCRYVVIPDAGHAANLDNPAFFEKLLLDFLKEHA